MTKTEIKKALSDAIGGAVVISYMEVAKVMRMRKETAAEICSTCHYDKRGRKKFYYIEDVATRLAERRMM